MDFPELLIDSVWHTTTLERFKSIVEDGYLLPDPLVADSDRWGTAMGPDYYPFVRSISGVSLFDFREFDAALYSEKYPMSTWREFVPCSHRSSAAVWMEIDVPTILEHFVEGKALLKMWRQTNKLARNIMPVVEAAHIGAISVESFRQVFVYNKQTQEFVAIDHTS